MAVWSSLSAQTTSLGPGLTSRDLEAWYELPQRDLADSLVDAYFNHVHRLYGYVHEGSFRAEYERMWRHLSLSELSLPSSWLGILNLIFAFGCEFCDAVKEKDVLTTSSRFVARSRSILFSQIFKAGSLEMAQALLLMCHECWNLVGLMIRTAVSIGLHLNPTAASMTSVEKEVRKRVWWGCFVIDRTLSMKFGRPPSIRVTDGFDVELPLDVDDQYITNDSTVPRQPAGRPSMTGF
jgi:hypothetical protein